MIKMFAIAASAAMIVSSGAAFAKDADPAATAKPIPATATKTRYCVKEQAVTGTILERKVCKTLDQWRAIGFDPTKQDR